MNHAIARRAGPLFGAWLMVVGILAAFTPLIPPAAALDPTPGPSGVVDSPSPAPAPTISPDPSAGASTDPGVSPDPSPIPSPTIGPDPSLPIALLPTPVPSPSAQPSQPPGPGLRVEHSWIDTEDTTGAYVTAGALDSPLAGMDRFVVYRVRFQVLNAADSAVTLRPLLEAGSGANPTTWNRVAVVDPVRGQPFYAASDEGRTFRVRTSAIGPSDFRLSASSDPSGTPVAGIASAGVNPLASLPLPAHGYTEIQFAVRATVDAQWDATYAFRLDLGVPGALSSGVISATMRSLPPDVLPPGAQAGVPVETPLPVHRLTPPAAVTATLAMARLAPSGTQYPLGNQTFTSPHANYTLTSDACAACHSAHTAQGPYLERQSAISALCFTCHDGSGAVANVKAEYNSNPVPKPNDPTTSSYYSHPATSPSNHTSDQGQEFAGVLNRHAQCVDCHQPHNSDATVPVGQVDGWTAGGPIRGASGVAVTNGTANTSPTFTWQRTTTLEYQLCFKCHSGYTQLLARDTAHPSRWALDKAVELNPANVAYHPVEAQGKNQTSAMAASLSGLATGKLWIFSTTSTIRCENCHGTSIATNPAVNAQIDNHASANRGILLRNYRDRVLKPASESYLAGDFALCYLCHAEAPMKAVGGSPRADTNFELHGKHVSGLVLIGGGGTDIDVAGAGQGNAVCAECHFRIHGDALAVNGQTPAPGLVNFAPDVQPNDGSTNPSLRGVFLFVPATPTSLGTCTLTCHGKPHDAFIY